MLAAVEHRFGDTLKAPEQIEWLTDNGSGLRRRKDPCLCCRRWPEAVDDAGVQPAK
jgi:uncharacterized protein (DUF2237 family)